MQQRILSAAVLIPLVIVLTWWSVWSMVVFAAAAAALAAVELLAAFRTGGFHVQLAAGVALALVPVAAAAAELLVGAPLILPALTFVTLASLVAFLPRHHEPGSLGGWAVTLAGALYTGGLLCHLVLLREVNTPLRPGFFADAGLAPGAAWVFLTMFVTWGQDTLAYFVGKYLGRTKMTSLSPKKTWEGAAGGMLGAVASGALAVQLFGLPIDLLTGALLGAIGGVVGPLGDLSESFVKRQVGLKDAGSLIPGHGGVLDRIDSLLFTVPVLFYTVSVIISR